MLSIDGLVTGIDTTTIISGLLNIQQTQIDLLGVRRQTVLEEQNAFKGIEAGLLTLQSHTNRLSRIHDSVFQRKSVTSSHEDIVAATASESAAVGSYNIRVNSLAAAHQVATQGLADPDSAITEGTIALQVGSGTTTTITIDGSNNTLQGFADAINDSGGDFTAAIVNDGTGSGTPFRIMLSATKTGAENAISITNSLADSGGGSVKPVFDLGTPVQAAADASILIGSGAGALAVQSASNQIEDILPGLTLDLRGADSAQDITIVVGNDTEAAKDSINDFVSSFNDLMDYIDNQVRYDAETDQASLLLGNRSVTSIQDEVRLTVSNVVAGVATEMNRLTALGISFDARGHLNVDSARLDAVLSGNVEGVDMSDVQRLFSLDGQSDNGNIRFVLAGDDTVESTTPYEVDILQAAERAQATATNTLAASTVIDGSNNQLTITIDGKTSGTLTLAAGTYTTEELAAHLESVMNADDELGTRSVAVSVQSDRLQITSDTYGSSSEVTIGSGTALVSLGFDGSETDQGQNVVGNFLVDGVAEIATGTGQLLIGDASNANTAGLQVRVTLNQSQVQAGSDANLSVSRGIASRLGQVLNGMLDSVDGKIKTVNDGFEDEAETIQQSIDRLSATFTTQQESLLKQFAAMEAAVGQLQTTSSFLATQLAGVANLSLN
ncbi:MAG: flagellar filament capping protein FliD [Pirellulales bacterium]